MHKIEQVRTSHQQVFPFPEEGEIVWETPPCFIWIAEEEPETGYTITIRNDTGFFWEGHTLRNFLTPDKMLPVGEYEWNLATSNAQRGWKHFTIAENAVEFQAPSGREIYEAVPDTRPRHLFYHEDTELLLKERAQEIEVLKRNVEQAYKDGLPEEPRFWKDSQAVPYREYFGRYRDYVDRNLIACCYAWRLWKDPMAGAHAVALLNRICSWDPYEESALIGQKGDEVGLSNARCLPAAFDMLYDRLMPRERSHIAKVIEIYAQQCEDRLLQTDFVKNPGNSHVGRLPAYLGEAAMVLKGTGVPEEKLIRWLDLAADIFGGIFPFYGGSDGSWGEGPFYASSYTKWYLPFFCAVERYTGVSYLERPFYQRLSQYLLHFADPKEEIHPFGDGYWCSSEDPEWPGFMAQNPYRFYAGKFGPVQAQMKEKAIPQPELFKLHLLDIFLPYGKAPETHLTGTAQLAAAFPKAGVIDLCSSFEEPAMKVMIRASRYGSGSHSHADQGSFAVFYDGTALITPSGYFGYAYGTEHHQKWTNTTQAHNCILVDGKGQPVNSHLAQGSILHCEKIGQYLNAAVKIEGYEDLYFWERYFYMNAETRELMVEDVIEAKKSVTISWLLHTLSQPEVLRDGRIRVQRHGIDMEIKPERGLSSTALISDRYAVDLNEGLPVQQHVSMPPQYHITWKTKKAKQHHIGVKMKIQ